MTNNITHLIDFGTPQRKAITVVRVKRNFYRNSRYDFVSQVKLSILKRKSFGHQAIELDYDDSSCEDVMDRIRNLNDVVDGVYELKQVNISYDYETGYVDDWEYELIPFKE